MPVYPRMPKAPGDFPLLPQQRDAFDDPIRPTRVVPRRAGVRVLRHHDQVVHIDCSSRSPLSRISGTTSGRRGLGQ